MSTQKKRIKVFMFLLPAVVTLLGYAAFHELLFKKPPCLINCNTQSPFSDNEKLKKWLAFLESLRDNPATTQPHRGILPTDLDLAFLQDKITKHTDYLKRYNQAIDDLTVPNVLSDNDQGHSPSIQLAQLSTPNTTSDSNGQTFVGDSSAPDNSANPTFLVRPIGLPRSTSPYIFNPNNNNTNQPPIGGIGGNDGSNPGYGGTGGNGNPIGGNTDNNGNPISTVPVPKAIYLLIGLIALLVSIRIRGSQAPHY